MGPKKIRAKGGLGFFRKWRKSAIVRPAKIFHSETPTFELHSLDRPGSIGPRRGGTRRSTLDIHPRETSTKRSEEHTSELQAIMRISSPVSYLKNHRQTSIYDQETTIQKARV